MCSRNIGPRSALGFELGIPEIVRIYTGKVREYSLGGAETKQRCKDKNESSISAVMKLAAARVGGLEWSEEACEEMASP